MEAQQLCRSGTHRVAFTDSAQPGAGVVVELECLTETQRLPSYDPRRAADQPEIGSACVGRRDASGAEIPRESACSVQLQDGTVDTKLFCHGELNVCVAACSGDSECPPAWVCDTRPASTARTAGRGFCVNPTCGSD